MQAVDIDCIRLKDIVFLYASENKRRFNGHIPFVVKTRGALSHLVSRSKTGFIQQNEHVTSLQSIIRALLTLFKMAAPFKMAASHRKSGRRPSIH